MAATLTCQTNKQLYNYMFLYQQQLHKKYLLIPFIFPHHIWTMLYMKHTTKYCLLYHIVYDLGLYVHSPHPRYLQQILYQGYNADNT